VVKRHAEIDGILSLGDFKLRGRADRIDTLADGTAELIDFKTGGIPQSREMTDFLAPQLPLEAAMLKAGAFAGVEPVPASALTYIKIGLGPDAFVLNPYRYPDTAPDAPAAAAEMLERLQRYVDVMLLHDALPMAANVLPKGDIRQRRFIGDYDQLSRLDEWSLNEGDESE
jgi:ATP-dependent helicase/nuclease subunit B